MVWGLSPAALALMKAPSKAGSGSQRGESCGTEAKPTSEPGESTLIGQFSFCALLKS